MATAPAPPQHFEHEEEEYATSRAWTRQPDWVYFTPVAIGASIPLLRLALRNHPTWRNRVFAMAVGAGVLHGGYLISRANQTDTAGIPAVAVKKKAA